MSGHEEDGCLSHESGDDQRCHLVNWRYHIPENQHCLPTDGGDHGIYFKCHIQKDRKYLFTGLRRGTKVTRCGRSFKVQNQKLRMIDFQKACVCSTCTRVSNTLSPRVSKVFITSNTHSSGMLSYSWPSQKCLNPQRHRLFWLCVRVLSPFWYIRLPSSLSFLKVVLWVTEKAWSLQALELSNLRITYSHCIKAKEKVQYPGHKAQLVGLLLFRSGTSSSLAAS